MFSCLKGRNKGFLHCALAAGRRWNWCVTVDNIDFNDLARTRRYSKRWKPKCEEICAIRHIHRRHVLRSLGSELCSVAGKERYGLHWKKPKEKQAVRLETLLAVRVERVGRIFHQTRRPWLNENPATARGWHFQVGRACRVEQQINSPCEHHLAASPRLTGHSTRSLLELEETRS